MKILIRLGLAIALALGMLSLSACAHRDLTAPCSRDAHWLSMFGSAIAATDCGTLQPVNR